MMAFALMTTSCSLSENANVALENISYKQEDLNAKYFNTIHVEAVADVYYKQNDKDDNSVRLDFSAITDQELAQRLKESVKVVYRNDGVEIGLSKKVVGINKLSGDERLKVYINSTDLVGITMEGVGTFHADIINTDRMKIDNEGVGSILIKSMMANQLNIDNEGVGSVKITTVKADQLNIDNEGVGSVKIDAHKGDKVDILNEGVGKVTVTNLHCNRLKAQLEGVGSVVVSGTTRHFEEIKEGVGKIKKDGLKVL